MCSVSLGVEAWLALDYWQTMSTNRSATYGVVASFGSSMVCSAFEDVEARLEPKIDRVCCRLP
ncbi:hypothetical protein RSAG8_12924, partial [Rhizoctonia solani AG-8 WAC10335]